jgi:hypothetical protein
MQRPITIGFPTKNRLRRSIKQMLGGSRQRQLHAPFFPTAGMAVSHPALRDHLALLCLICHVIHGRRRTGVYFAIFSHSYVQWLQWPDYLPIRDDF